MHQLPHVGGLLWQITRHAFAEEGKVVGVIGGMVARHVQAEGLPHGGAQLVGAVEVPRGRSTGELVDALGNLREGCAKGAVSGGDERWRWRVGGLGVASCYNRGLLW